MYEVREITLRVLVNSESEGKPEKWDWSDLTDSAWCVPASDSTVVATFATEEEFRDALDAGDPRI